MSVPELLSLSEVEKVRLWPDAGSVHYRAPVRMSDSLRDAIIANKPALLVKLAEWDATEAVRLEHAADGTVEASGVSGTDPGIADLATECAATHLAHDMSGVRRACALIENRVRQLSQRRAAA